MVVVVISVAAPSYVLQAKADVDEQLQIANSAARRFVLSFR